MIFILILTIFCSVLIYRLVNYFSNLQRMYRILEPISGPGRMESFWLMWNILYGKSPSVFSSEEPVGARVSKQSRELCDRFGRSKGVVKVGYGLFPPFVYICNGMLAKKILADSNFQNKADIHHFLGKVVTGNGMLTCDRFQAQIYRLELIKHFSKKSLESYIDNFLANLDILDSKIDQAVNSNANGVIEDIKPTISTLVLDSIGDNLFSTRFNSQTEPANLEPTFITAIEYCLTEADRLLVEQWKTLFSNEILLYIFSVIDPTIWKLPALIMRLTNFKLSMLLLVFKLYWKVFRQRRTVDHFQPASMMEAVVNRRMTELQNSGISPLTFYNGLQESFWHLSIFMLAGHQTSTMTLTWALYFLCKHENVKRKLQEEVDEFLKDSPKMTEVLNNKSALRYLEAVLKETMRLAPAGPYLGRKAATDIELPVFSEDSPEKYEGTITIPAGTDVIVMLQYMHYSERYFREAKSFKPERFLKTDDQEECENSTTTSSIPPCYNPFSAGTRACIGEKYAMLQMKLALVSICRKYDFTFAYPETVCEPQHHMVQGPARFPIKFSHRWNS